MNAPTLIRRFAQGLRSWLRSRPARTLRPRHRPRILRHLLALDADDRYLRFGQPTSDEQIRRYVEALDFGRDRLLGVHDRHFELVAMAHLAAPGASGIAEFGVSVARRARRRGHGVRLFRRALLLARLLGATSLVVHALGENLAMLNLARKCGASVLRDGPEAEGRLSLPPLDTPSRLLGAFHHLWGELDYRLKRQRHYLSAALEAVLVVGPATRRRRAHRLGG